MYVNIHMLLKSLFIQTLALINISMSIKIDITQNTRSKISKHRFVKQTIKIAFDRRHNNLIMTSFVENAFFWPILNTDHFHLSLAWPARITN